MKRLMMVFALMVAMVTMSEAAYINIYNLGPVSFSGDSFPYTGPTTDDVYMSQWGSVWIGKPYDSSDSFVYAEGTTQPMGNFGAGVVLPATSGGYNVKFDYHLYTYDSSSNDAFKVNITTGGYIWSGGTSLGGFAWGGVDRGVLETTDFAPADWQFFIDVPGGETYYLNVFLVADHDTSSASWGRFSDVAVEVVPEASGILLLGSGLVGLLGYRRMRRMM